MTQNIEKFSKTRPQVEIFEASNFSKKCVLSMKNALLFEFYIKFATSYQLLEKLFFFKTLKFGRKRAFLMIPTTTILYFETFGPPSVFAGAIICICVLNCFCSLLLLFVLDGLYGGSFSGLGSTNIFWSGNLFSRSGRMGQLGLCVYCIFRDLLLLVSAGATC